MFRKTSVLMCAASVTLLLLLHYCVCMCVCYRITKKQTTVIQTNAITSRYLYHIILRAYTRVESNYAHKYIIQLRYSVYEIRLDKCYNKTYLCIKGMVGKKIQCILLWFLYYTYVIWSRPSVFEDLLSGR